MHINITVVSRDQILAIIHYYSCLIISVEHITYQLLGLLNAFAALNWETINT